MKSVKIEGSKAVHIKRLTILGVKKVILGVKKVLGPLKVHKNTNVPLILKDWDVIVFYLGKTPNRPFLGVFWGGLDFFDF